MAEPGLFVVSRRNASALILAIVLAGGCGGGGSSPAPPTAPRCMSVAGVWQATWSLPLCGPQVGGTSQVTLAENAVCSPTFTVPGLGVVAPDPSRAPDGLTLAFDAAVPGLDAGCIRTGSAELRRTSATELVVPFGGTISCCQHGTVFLRR